MVWGWIKRLFGLGKPSGTSRTVLVKDTEKGKLWAIIARGTCPDCDSKAGFDGGPSDGMNTNIQCVSCLSLFNVTPIVGIAERID